MDRKPEVLAFLKARGGASLTEVAAHLHVSKQGAQRHLESLRTSGLVSAETADHRRPGRPELRYRLTEAAAELFPRGHRELAAELVDYLEPELLERFFAARAARMEARYAERMAGLDFQGRAQELARMAAETGHMTELGTGPRGELEIRHCNCPIEDVAARTGFACQQEREMYERLLGATARRSSWLGHGDSSCTYEIEPAGDAQIATTAKTKTLPRSRRRRRSPRGLKGEVNG
ncbi:MAG: MarR family transcriptional regulator [Candidatus Dormibacteraeota bacterium]|nr:MarR family transcriptional regulator [Candidatus Dormibacteraeota bacterium]MBO0703943.1 MarR family transcriptional regulator [Candidatus Dormibacteraeota bacterium]MBO0761121.1 MarR family transcriptional regulator [Candidatus Dormibacteraeota bacterium]